MAALAGTIHDVNIIVEGRYFTTIQFNELEAIAETLLFKGRKKTTFSACGYRWLFTQVSKHKYEITILEA